MPAFTYHSDTERLDPYVSYHSGYTSLDSGSTLAYERVSVPLGLTSRPFDNVSTDVTRGAPSYITARESDVDGNPFCDDTRFLNSDYDQTRSVSYRHSDDSYSRQTVSTTTVTWDDSTNSWQRTIDTQYYGDDSTPWWSWPATTVTQDTASSYAYEGEDGYSVISGIDYSLTYSNPVTYGDSMAYYERYSGSSSGRLIGYISNKSSAFNPQASGSRQHGALTQPTTARIYRYATGTSSEEITSQCTVSLVTQEVQQDEAAPQDHYRHHGVSQDSYSSDVSYEDQLTTGVWGESGNHSSITDALTNEPYLETRSVYSSITSTHARAGGGARRGRRSRLR